MTAPAACPVGLYCPSQGLSSPAQCQAGSYCPTASITAPIPCPTGAYSSTTSASSCTACTASVSFADGQGFSACTTCASSALVTQASCAVDETIQTCTVTSDRRCVKCTNKIDNASPSHVCVWTCLAGYFKNSSNLCQACRTGLTCSTGSFTLQCTSVADQTCSACTNAPANAFYTGSGGQGTAATPGQCPWGCNAGYYQATVQDTFCTPCAPGSVSLAGSSSCTPCAAGTYASTPVLCLPCQNGTFTETAGNTACQPCALCATVGVYRKACGGASAGVCQACTN